MVIHNRHFDVLGRGGEVFRQETRRYEYRDSENQTIRTRIEFEEIPIAPEREKYARALLSRGYDFEYVKKQASEVFAGKRLKKIASFILINDEGEELDVLEDCHLEEKNILVTESGHAGVYEGYDGFLVRDPRELQDIIIFLHELGHFEQNTDEAFQATHKDTPRERESNAYGEIVSSAYIIALEVDANRRAWERAESWRKRDFDITGYFEIKNEDAVMQELLKQEGADVIRSQVRGTGYINFAQMIELQLLQHGVVKASEH